METSTTDNNQTEGGSTNTDRLLELYFNTLPLVVGKPKIGDRWTLGSDSYVVLEVSESPICRRYRLGCRSSIIVFDLRDLVSIWIGTPSLDSAGLRVLKQVETHVGVPAKIKLESEEQREVRRVSRLVRTSLIYLQDDYQLSVNDTIRDGGTVYQILSTVGRENFTSLPAYRCESVL